MRIKKNSVKYIQRTCTERGSAMENSVKPFIFVSYNRQDSDKVFKILQRLHAEGIYFKGDNLNDITDFTSDVLEEIHTRKLIRECIGVVAFHSQNSKNSARCKEEIFFAREESVNKKIISVYLDNVELSVGVMMKINRFPIINFYRHDENFYSELLTQIKAFLIPDDDEKTAEKMPFGFAAIVACLCGVGAIPALVVLDADADDNLNLKSYEGNEPYVFISYSHADSEKVFDILGKFQDEGLRFWYDAGIKHGSDWQECIAEHIRDCECMIAFHSKNSNESEHCKDEIAFAKWREINKKIFSVYLEKVKLSLGTQMAILRFQYINFYDYKEKKIFYDELLGTPLIKPCLPK